ncbi:MAG: cytochrome c oxidase accessory protein CcoG [Rhodocyclaceae bacterium]|nr:cytochrome c oxidase accessory protein CcoG [Rhodocyclaceae bacterium]
MSESSPAPKNSTSSSRLANAMAETADTADLYSKSRKLYVRSVKGRFATWRWALVWITQLIFYGLPWLQWDDRQAVLFHLVERKFYIFGWVFWPQDVIYLSLILIISAYSLFFFTAIAGRLWCGYACPQTVYTEIFMWLEEKIEGDHNKRRKLDAAPWDGRKISIRATKYLVWALVALWTGFTFVAYFTPLKTLFAELVTFSFGPWETFWIFFYAAFTYVLAAVLREQVCKYMCPYARFQSVMFDSDTMIITYDNERGEPRGVARRKTDDVAKKGDCIDCLICVQACPTGIDIRNGLQYECIGCAACADACDEVMDRIKKPRGLIRYTTENAMKQHWTRQEILRHVARPRTLIYSAILLLVITVLLAGLALRPTLRMDVIPDRIAREREVAGGRIENVYRLQIINLLEVPRTLRITVTGLDGLTISNGQDRIVTVPGGTREAVTVDVQAPMEAGEPGANPIQFHLETQPGDPKPSQRVEKSTFMLPHLR